MSGFTISGKHTDDMNARVFVILSIHAFLSNCVTVILRSQAPNIISKSKVELTPILIKSGLNDIVVLSAPILDAKAIYYLHKPNGDARQLNFKNNETDEKFRANNVITNKQFTIFNVNYHESCCGTTAADTHADVKMSERDFMIGPLQEEDHGNWVLSTYYKDLDGHWIELFQVITMEIIELVPLYPEKSLLNTGDAFTLSFAYPLQDLESCQIEPPRSTVDRFFDRTRNGLDTCEYIMKNVTIADEGTWTIIGVGRIVYKGTASLYVRGTK